MNIDPVQHQGTEMTSDIFQTVLTDVNLKSFLRILSFSKSRKYDS